MELWNIYVTAIAEGINFISLYFGISEALAIISFTLICRILLMPISLGSAYKTHKNKLAIEKIKPDIEIIRKRYKDDPAKMSKKTMSIYKKNGIKFLDRLTVVNIGSQGVLGLGIFQALKEAVFGSKFMWIASIAKPDFILALIVGFLTYLSMVVMPGTVEHQTMLLFILPAVISTIVLVSFPSALGLYWAASNVVTTIQMLILRVILRHEQHSTAST